MSAEWNICMLSLTCAATELLFSNPLTVGEISFLFYTEVVCGEVFPHLRGFGVSYVCHKKIGQKSRKESNSFKVSTGIFVMSIRRPGRDSTEEMLASSFRTKIMNILLKARYK